MLALNELWRIGTLSENGSFLVAYTMPHLAEAAPASATILPPLTFSPKS